MKQLGEYIKRHRWPLAAAAVAAVTLVAAIPVSAAMLADNTITACYVKGSGIMYIVGQPGMGQKCRGKQHTEITWNIQGPQGPQGPAGPTGPGVTDIETVSQEFAATSVGNGGVAQGSVDCPSGKILVSGGAQIRAANNGIPGFIALVDNAPAGNGWTAIAREVAIPVPPGSVPAGGWHITILARCGTQTS